jgi:hypothetical protein
MLVGVYFAQARNQRQLERNAGFLIRASKSITKEVKRMVMGYGTLVTEIVCDCPREVWPGSYGGVIFC